VNLVKYDNIKPKVNSFTVSNVKGSATLSMNCDSTGIALWVASVNVTNN
jgi:hypothetical protein